MPLDASAVGQSLGTIDVSYDDRRLMAFAAGVPDEHPSLYDTLAGVVVHPVFPVSPEWFLLVAQPSGGTGLTAEEVRRGIHIGHDLRISRALRSGDRVRLTAEIAGVGRIRAGAVQHTSFTALDEEGETVWRTLFTNLYLGVDLIGDPQPVERRWDAPALRPDRATWTGEPVAAATSFVRPVDAHVYSECAQIWNPIHTDVAAARRVGLDGPILHGTATLARSVSIAVDLATAERSNVIGVTGRFRSPVRLGSTITVRVLARDDAHVWFDTLSEDGTPAIADGVITLGNLR